MLNFFKQLISDSSTYSMTRFLSLLCIVSAILISLTVIVKNQTLDSAIGLVSVFLGAGFAGKVVQKYAEVKQAKDADNEER